jgi:hypothetical protein
MEHQEPLDNPYAVPIPKMKHPPLLMLCKGDARDKWFEQFCFEKGISIDSIDIYAFYDKNNQFGFPDWGYLTYEYGDNLIVSPAVIDSLVGYDDYWDEDEFKPYWWIEDELRGTIDDGEGLELLSFREIPWKDFSDKKQVKKILSEYGMSRKDFNKMPAGEFLSIMIESEIEYLSGNGGGSNYSSLFA